MIANRKGNTVVVELTPQETHVLIWGGPIDLVEKITSLFRNMLVDVEDDQFSDAEYNEYFNNLPDMYAKLQKEIEVTNEQP